MSEYWIKNRLIDNYESLLQELRIKLLKTYPKTIKCSTQCSDFFFKFHEFICAYIVYVHTHTTHRFECVSRWFKATAAAIVVCAFFAERKTCLICTTTPHTTHPYRHVLLIYLYIVQQYICECLLWICRWINQRVSCLFMRLSLCVFLVLLISQNIHTVCDREVYNVELPVVHEKPFRCLFEWTKIVCVCLSQWVNAQEPC